jgi:metal-responsive CopG/Arc/MetJ family transcriptional regulator
MLLVLLIRVTMSANRTIAGVSFPKLLVEELDTVRGDIPRSKYIARLLEKNFTLMEKET